ncbi:hypothetical protein KW429_11150 [Vibrio fluvialis]|nr:hypothetical protein [Vibrio fluvialis]MBY7902409.1 hypothetical protein [Vibrio fluvialis]
MTTQTKIGILWVDDIRSQHATSIRNGYICTGTDAQSVQLINLQDLPQQYLWISNLTSNRFSYTDTHKKGAIKNSAFLGIKLSTIAIELGLTDELTDKLPVLYQVCKGIVDRIERKDGGLGISMHDVDYNILDKIHRTCAPIQSDMVPTLNGARDPKLQNAIENSMQKMQASALQKKGHLHEVQSAHFSKSPFMLTLLNLIYPMSNNYWESDEFSGWTIGKTEMGECEQNAESLQTLTEFGAKHCAFVEFEQLQTLTHVNTYYPLGRERQGTSPRHWATLPEIIDMANYSTLKLGKAYVTHGGKLPNAPSIPHSQDVMFTSYINGLVNQIQWMALSYDQRSAATVSPVSTYMRAYDRIICRIKAEQFIQEKFEVCGFNGGTVRFLIGMNDQIEKDRLKKAIFSKNMIPQFNLLR